MADIVTMGGQPYDPKLHAMDLRGKVLGRMLTLVAPHLNGISYSDVFEDILKTFEMEEERIGPDILCGAFFLDRVNLLRISTLAPGEHKPMISADTKLVPMLNLHSFMSDDF